MRPKLVRMLDAVAIPALLGATASASLWDADFELFHPTSVVPHAAFRDGEPFAGSFEDLLTSW